MSINNSHLWFLWVDSHQTIVIPESIDLHFTASPLSQLFNTSVTNFVRRPWCYHGSLLVVHFLDKLWNFLSLFHYNKTISCITKYVRNINTTSCTISSKNFEKPKVGVYRKIADQICPYSLPTGHSVAWQEQLWLLFSFVSHWLQPVITTLQYKNVLEFKCMRLHKIFEYITLIKVAYELKICTEWMSYSDSSYWEDCKTSIISQTMNTPQVSVTDMPVHETYNRMCHFHL
jgi:hypothetical protein